MDNSAAHLGRALVRGMPNFACHSTSHYASGPSKRAPVIERGVMGWELRGLLCLLALAAVQCQTSTQTDQVRLLTQRNATTNWDEYAAANNITGWVADNSKPVCLWTGVTCNADGRIESLALQCPTCPLKMEGTVSKNLSQIQPMKTLNLQQQRLGGPLPPEYGGNTSFPNLINLLLQQNQLTGTVPASWGSPGSFPQLALLTLSGNNLTGQLPELDLWPNANVIRAQQNQFSGTLPASWAKALPKLQILSLYQNRIQGSLPGAWADPDAFPLLEELYLQYNQIEGGLPSKNNVALQFQKLRVLDLSFNKLAGTLPADWGLPGGAPSLEILKLSNISLIGSLPAKWGEEGHGLNKVRQIWLDGNDLTGTIPASWANLTNLQHLFVRPGNMKLCGPLPPGLPFKLCSSSGNTECNVTVALDGPTCPPWVPVAPPPPAPPPPPPPPPAGTSSNTGAIVGGVVGGVVGGALLAVLVVFLCRRHKRRRRREAPFIAEAQAPIKPALDDLSNYVKVLETVEGGSGPEPLQSKPSRWSSRVLASVASLFSSSSGLPPSPIPDDQLPPRSPPLPPLTPPPSGGGNGNGNGSAGQSLGPATESLVVSSCELSSVLPPHYPPPLPNSKDSEEGGRNAEAQARAAADAQLYGSDSGLANLSDWEIKPEEIEYMKKPDGSDWELGVGGFGKVYKALRNGAQPVAVKVLASGPETRYMALTEFRREVAILKACRDPNIVAFLGACLRDDCAMLVTEYCEGGNLSRNILARKVNWHRRGRKVSLDIAKGLVFLHSRRIVHLDLKSPNILLSRDGTAKIADVGLAKIIAQEYSAVTGAVGTLAWSSPEMLLGARCTEKSDIYSYGVVLWEIATGQTPIRGQLRDVKVPEECPEELRDLMLDCLEQNPKRRPSAHQVIERLRKIPVSPLEHQPALPPASQRPPVGAANPPLPGRPGLPPVPPPSLAGTGASMVSGQLPPQPPPPRPAAAPAAQSGPAAAALPAAGEPTSPGGTGMVVSAFAAAAAAAPPSSVPSPTPLSTSTSVEQSSSLPTASRKASIAHAGSLYSPFNNSSTAATHLPAWSDSEELNSKSVSAARTPAEPAAAGAGAGGGAGAPAAAGAGAPAAVDDRRVDISLPRPSLDSPFAGKGAQGAAR